MQILYLDDSGKIHVHDSSKVVVFGGFSVDEGTWHRLIRQVTGAKAHFFPHRDPNTWEIHSQDFLTRNNWQRARKRMFCNEIARILERNACHVYAAEKAKAQDALEEEKFVPLSFQRLIAKFHSEIINTAKTGSIVCDWSTHQLDRHLTHCVTSMVVSKDLELLRGGMTYGSSKALVPLQVADLIAGAFRRCLEGQHYLDDFMGALANLRYQSPGQTDVHGHPVDSVFKLF
jgi:hypothetical protein